MQHCLIEGTITKKDPELKQTAKGKSICSFTVCLQSGYGNYKRKDYMNCTAFGKTADTIAKYFKQHYAIQLTGEFQNNPYKKNENGYDIPNWQFIVNSFSFPPQPKPEGADEEDSYDDGSVSSVEGVAADSNDFSVVDDGEDLPF